MKYTTFIGLKKPELTDYVDIADINYNMDIIDSEVKKIYSSVISVTLSAASWTGSSAPFSITVPVAGVTTTSANEVLPSLTITAAQLEALQSANIQDGGQATGSITLKAFGDKPSINLPLRVIVRGDL
ncbi:MAG: hypothetical protein ACOX4U_00420 [Anaerovoracaceae bacterium]|jgi:hypothetical protein